jgi:5-methylcytosine-specific restriction endonuclease McrA
MSKANKVRVTYADGRVEIRKPGSFRKPSKYVEWKASRNVFYTSKEWVALRRARKHIDRYVCQHCSKSGSGIVLNVHHLTYERFGGDETMEDLVTLCRPCHRAIHRKA